MLDPYNDKTIRASTGAVFLMPILYNVPLETVQQIINHNSDITNYVATSKLPERKFARQKVIQLTKSNVESLNSGGKAFLVLGNESSGPSDELANLCQNYLMIPTQKVDSLNVNQAASILLFSLKN